jgi:threonine/homoserine efflux transporter RhtA
MSRFWGGLLMAIGIILALTCGLCSVLFTGVMLQEQFGGQEKNAFNIMIGFIIAGFVVAGFGIWLFRRGLARVRED